MMSTNQAVDSHTCPTCGQAFTRSNNLVRHTKTMHSSQQRHSCPICSRSYKRKDGLQRHIKIDHELPNVSTAPPPIVIAALAFTNAPQVPPDYSMAAAASQFKSTSTSKSSMSSSDESNLHASSRDDSDNDEDVTKETSVSSEETSSGKCDKQKSCATFTVVVNENDPCRTTGSLCMEVEEINTDTSKTNSEQTAATYTMSSTGQTHVTSVMNTRTIAQPLSDQIYSNRSCSTYQARDTHLCPTCGELFTRLNNLLRHTRTMHGSQQRHSCPICSRLYKRKDILQRHIKIDHKLPYVNAAPPPTVSAALAFTNAPQVPPDYSMAAAESRAQSTSTSKSSMSSSDEINQHASSREQAYVVGPAFSLADSHEGGHKLQNVNVPQTSNDSHQFAPVIMNMQTWSLDDVNTNSMSVSGPKVVSTQEPQICIGSVFNLADSHIEHHNGQHETENEFGHVAIDNYTSQQTLLEHPALPHVYQQNKTISAEKEHSTVSSQFHTTMSTEQNQYSALCSRLNSLVCLPSPLSSSSSSSNIIYETNILSHSITSSKNGESVEVSSPKDDSQLLRCSTSIPTSAAHQLFTSVVTSDAQLLVSQKNGSIMEAENKTTDLLRDEETHEKPASLTKPQDSSSTSQMLPNACKVQEPEIVDLDIEDINDCKRVKIDSSKHNFPYGSKIHNSEVMIDDSDNVEDVTILTKETSISRGETSSGKCDKLKSSASSTVVVGENDPYGNTGSLNMEVEEINTEASKTNSEQTAVTYTMSFTGQTHATSVMSTRTNTQLLSNQIYSNGSCSTWHSSEIENPESELMDLPVDDDDDDDDNAPLSSVEYVSLKLLTPSQHDKNVSIPFTQSMFSSSSLLSSTSDIPVFKESYHNPFLEPDIQVQAFENTLKRKIKIPSAARSQKKSPSHSDINFKTVESALTSTATDSSVMCKLCFMFFSTRMELVTHTWNRHRSSQFVENNLKCDGCGKCFANNSLLKLHKKVECTSSNTTNVDPGTMQVSLDSILHTIIKQKRVSGAPEVSSSSAIFRGGVEPQLSTAGLSSGSATIDISNSTHVDVSSVLNSFPQRNKVISNYSAGVATEAATDKHPDFYSFQLSLHQQISEGCKVARNDCVQCFVCAKTFKSNIIRYLHVLNNPECKEKFDRYCNKCSHLFNSLADKQDHLRMFKACRIYEECILKDPLAKNVGHIEQNVKEPGNQLHPVFTACEISQPDTSHNAIKCSSAAVTASRNVFCDISSADKSLTCKFCGAEFISENELTHHTEQKCRKLQNTKAVPQLKNLRIVLSRVSVMCPVCHLPFADDIKLAEHLHLNQPCQKGTSERVKRVLELKKSHLDIDALKRVGKRRSCEIITGISDITSTISMASTKDGCIALTEQMPAMDNEIDENLTKGVDVHISSNSSAKKQYVCDQGNANNYSKGHADDSDKDEIISSMSSSDEGSDMEESGSSSEEGDQDYTCKQCCKTYTSKSLLIQHNKSHHKSAHSKMTHCKVCKRKFHDLTGLQAHMLQFKFCFIPLTRPLWEQKQDPQICSMCKKILSSSKDLQKHCFKKMACRLRYINMVLKNMKEKDNANVLPAAEAEIPVLKTVKEKGNIKVVPAADAVPNTGKENCEIQSANEVSSSVHDYCNLLEVYRRHMKIVD